jgi:hypothetical protein
MAIIEFQMSTAAFLGAQRNALLQRRICLPGPFAFNAVTGIGPINIVLDRVEFGANALVHSVKQDFDLLKRKYGGLPDELDRTVIHGFKTQMTQDVTVHVTTLEDILSHPNQSPATVVPVHGTLVFDISAYALIESGIFMRIEFQSKDSTIVPPPGGSGLPVDWGALTQTIMTEIAKFLPSPTIPIDLKDLATSGRFLNADTSVHTTGSRFALRADNSLYPAEGQWIDFYNGRFADRLGGNEWALFLEQDFMGSAIDGRIEAGLKEDLPDEVHVYPHTSYSNADGRAVFTIALSVSADIPDPGGAIIDAFPCVAGNGHANITIPLEFRLESPSVLVTDADVSTIQAQAQDQLGLAGTLIDILALSLQGFIDAGAQSALSGISDGGGKCEITPEHHIRCTKPIKAPSVGFNAAFRVNSLLPLVDGMSLAGSLGMMNLSTAVLDIGARPLRLAPPAIDCGTAGASTIAAFGANPRAWEIVQGAIAITNQGTAPLFLCDYQIVGNDWANAFPRTGVRPDGGVAPIDIPVRFAAPDVRYYQGGGPGRPANYPCLVLIKTTAGTRAVSLGPAPLITQEKLDQLETELLVEVGNCQLLVDNWWDGNHVHNPDWFIPDPPDMFVDHQWQFVVTGLPVGEAAALIDTGGRLIARAVGRANAPVRLSTVVRPVAGQRDLTLVKLAANVEVARRPFVRTLVSTLEAVETEIAAAIGYEDAEARGEARGIAVTQQSLIRIGSALLTAPCVDVVSARGLGTRMIVAVMPDSVAAYDVSQPLQPLLMGEWSFAGARGALPWQGGVLVFGDEGFAMLDADGMCRTSAGRCSSLAVRSAAVAGNGLYALTKDGVAIHDARLCKLRTVELDDEIGKPRSIVAAGAVMIIGTSEGIATLPTDRPIAARPVRAERPLCVRRLSTPTTQRTGASVLAELEDGSACLLEVGNECVEEVVSFAEPPWFSRTARAGNVLAHRATDASRLEFYRLGPSVTR